MTSRTNVSRRSRRATTAGRVIETLENRLFLDATAHNLAAGNFSQNWTNTGLITTDDNWTGVPSIIGYRGDDITTATGVNPQTLVAPAGPGGAVQDVNANRNDPNVFNSG